MQKTMLIVDDNEINQGLLTSIFEDDFIIKTANDGRAALATLNYFGENISVVLLDLVMPGMDGFQVLKKVRENPKLLSIPVIVVSSQTSDNDGLEAIRCGAADFVPKPVDPDLIRIRVEAAISRAENAQLRAENDYITLQSSEQAKYRTVLDSTGTVVVEFDRVSGTFKYDPLISRHMAGRYDNRRLWQILMSDMVADVMDVKAMQDLVFNVDNQAGRANSMNVRLKTPSGQMQWFRMQIFRQGQAGERTDRMILTFNNINDEVESQEKLRYQAERDALTGLYNRAAFLEKAAEMITLREPGFYIMACFNITNFKVINDQYGTEKGDQVLKQIADIFTDGLEPAGGLVGRIMADNFAVLYPASLVDSDLLPRIRNDASLLDGSLHPISFSIGRYHIDDLSLPVNAMYDRAAMAEASIKGRYDLGLAWYDESMRDRLIRGQEIVNEMEAALASGQFEVWLQPQVNHSTGAHIGAEALVRWRHPQKGIIPPGEFIPIFESNGFVYDLDKYVWEQTCVLLRRWIDQGRDPLPVSVNISRHDLFHEDLVEVITGIVGKNGVPLDMLRLEITESAFAKSTQQVVTVVKSLIDHGFTVEIDDFGSGYSSLNTLKDVPAHVLKLDMRFLENGEDADRGGNVLESVVRMAKWLGMAVIAEGVETIEQADYLKSIGCVYMQGYLFAKPMTSGEYEARFRDTGKEEKLLALETVRNLDNNAFWDARSMDTLIFNSFVGSACITEYSNGRVELLRVSELFMQTLGSRSLTVEEALKLDWKSHYAPESLLLFNAAVEKSIASGENVTGEYVFLQVPGCPEKTYLRITLRVIASTGHSYLVYCLNENITAQKELEEKEREANELLQAIMANMSGGVNVAVIKDGVPQVRFANEQYYATRGYTKEQYEAEVLHLDKIIHPEDREMMYRATSTATEPFSIVYRITRRDNTVRWVFNNVTFVNLPGYDGPVQLSVTNDITELREAERKELELSKRLQAIMDALNSGVSGVTMSQGQMRLVFANDMYYTIFGYTKEQYDAEVINGFEVVHPEDRQRIQDEVERIFATGDSAVLEYRALRRDGEIRYLRVNASLLALDGVDGLVKLGVTNDITDMVKAQEKIEATIAHEQTALEGMMDDMPGGFARLRVLADGTLQTVYVNDAFSQISGLTREESLSGAAREALSLVHPEDLPLVRQVVMEMVATGEKRSIKYRHRRLSGDYVPLSAFGRAIVGNDGANYINIYCVELTSQEKMDMSIREATPHILSAILKSSSNLAFAKDKDFRYICCSAEFLKAHRLTGENDIIGKTDFDVFPPEVAGQFRRDDMRLLETNEPLLDYVDAIPSAGGVMRYFKLSKYILRDAFGNVLGLYGIGREVTEEKDAYARLKLLVDSIPGGVASYVSSPEGIRLTYFNDGFCGMLGYTHEEYESISATGLANLAFAEDVPQIVAKVQDLVREDKPLDSTHRVHTKGGGYKWVNLRGSVAERHDDVCLINAVLFDVTEHVEAENILRMSEEQFRAAAALGGRTVAQYDIRTSTYRHQDQALLERGFGPVIENVPQAFIEAGLIAAEYTEEFREFFERIRQGETHCSVDLAVVEQSGFHRWLRGEATVIADAKGAPYRAVIVFSDITELREKEAIFRKWQQSLEERPEETYMLFRCNLSKNCTLDSVEGRLFWISFEPGAYSFNERTREYARQCVYEEDRGEYLAFMNADTILANYYRGSHAKALEYREALPDGSLRWLRLTMELVEYPNSTDVEAFLLYEDINIAKREELHTRELAETDPLTGVLNRAAFAHAMERVMAESTLTGSLALLMLDIDAFKHINDTLGHACGDQVLRDTAAAIRGVLRRGDLLGRLGGDEFLICLRDVFNDEAVKTKAERICSLLRKSLNSGVNISISIGIAVCPRDGRDFQTLYRKADQALYAVKGAGKDNYSFYTPSGQLGNGSAKEERP